MNTDRIDMLLNKLPTKLRAEIIAAGLVENGLGMSDVLIYPIGAFARGYSKDIAVSEAVFGWWRKEEFRNIRLLEIYGEESKNLTYDEEKVAVIPVHRNGLYDQLPEGLIHLNKDAKSSPFKSPQEMLDEIKQNDITEKAARWFFLPLDAEFNRTRVEVELKERAAHIGLPYKLFDFFWQKNRNFDILDDQQRLTFLTLLPIMHKIVGDERLITVCLEAMTRQEVNLSTQIIEDIDLSKTTNEGLSDKVLGVNFMLGDVVCIEEEAVVVNIGPLSKEHLEDYLPGGKGLDVLNFLYDYFFPIETEVITNVFSDKNDTDFILMTDESTARLGYSSTI